jgi:hypothetical protein
VPPPRIGLRRQSRRSNRSAIPCWCASFRVEKSESRSSTQQQKTHEFDPAQLRTLVAALRGALPRLALAEKQVQGLPADIQTLESQAQSPNPKPDIIHEALFSVRAVLENAGVSLLASGLLQEIGKLFGS